MNLEELLGELRGAGTVDSAGHFSLDWRQAARKLGQHALSSPFRYVLRLVRCAVLAGATRIDVETNLGFTRFTCDADRFELPHLLDGLLDSRRPVQQELAVATVAALSTRPYELDIRGGGHRLCIGPQGTSVEPCNEPGLTFLMHRKKPKRSWLVDLTRHFNNYSPEMTVMQRRCAFCPIPLRVNGKKLNRPQEFGSPRLGPYVPPEYLLHELRFPAQGPNGVGLPEVSQARQCQGQGLTPVSFAVGLCHGRPQHFRPDQLDDFLFVQGGVALYREELGLGRTPVVGIVSCHGLTLDLAGDRVVKDGSYWERVELIRAQVVNSLP